MQITDYHLCGGPATGEWYEPRPWLVEPERATDRTLAINIEGDDAAQAAAAAAEWMRRYPDGSGGAKWKQWAVEAHAKARRLAGA